MLWLLGGSSGERNLAVLRLTSLAIDDLILVAIILAAT